MIKQNKKMIILTSIVTLLPIVIGLLLWNQLPQLMATHFNFNGNQMVILLKLLPYLSYH